MRTITIATQLLYGMPGHLARKIAAMSAIDRESAAGGLRLAELLTALSLATDLGMGQPLEHALRSCLIAIGLGERLRLRPEELAEVYYVALLRFVGCSADASRGGRDSRRRRHRLPRGHRAILGGSTEFIVHVMPKIGAGCGPSAALDSPCGCC